jgi:hypothetical protein
MAQLPIRPPNWLEEFRKFIEADYEKFGAVIRSGNISSD